MDIAPYRKTYFACARRLGLDEETRHAFNHAQTGKWSTRDFTVDDWRLVVSRLQADAGMNVQPGHPRIRGHGQEFGGMISPAQLELVTALVDRITWRYSAVSFVRSRLLSQFRKASWSGRWEDLFRSEATAAISAMRRMTSAAAG